MKDREKKIGQVGCKDARMQGLTQKFDKLMGRDGDCAFRFLPCRTVLCISLSTCPISSFPKLFRALQVSFLYRFLQKIEKTESK